jgi:hypothetical protein
MKKRLFVALTAFLAPLVILLVLMGLLCESSPGVAAPVLAAPNAIPAPVRQPPAFATPVTDGLSYLFEDFNDTIYQVNDFSSPDAAGFGPK